jgi:hypothetical protein
MPRVFFRHNTGAALLALGVGLALSVNPKGHAFREDEVECEETFAHLRDCCADVDLSALSCDYWEGCSNSTYPDLSPDESRCLRDLSCDRIRVRDVCARIVERSRGESPDTTRICP